MESLDGDNIGLLEVAEPQFGLAEVVEPGELAAVVLLMVELFKL